MTPRLLTPEEREALGMKIARAIAPKSWRQYDIGSGRCANADGMRCLDSISEAARVLNVLETEALIGRAEGTEDGR